MIATIAKTYSFRPSGRDFGAERAMTPEQRTDAMLARMTARKMVQGHCW